MGARCCQTAAEQKSVSFREISSHAVAAVPSDLAYPSHNTWQHGETGGTLSPVHRAPHLLLSHYPQLSTCVKFVDLKELASLPSPLPRCQDLPNRCFRKLRDGDLLVAVSHAWSHQMHPDPEGSKLTTMLDKILQDERVQTVQGVTGCAVFFDFLSITQRPFLRGQRPRTPFQSAEFATALKLMHFVYLYADVLLHIDDDIPARNPTRGVLQLPASGLGDVNFCQVGSTWQVDWIEPGVKHDIRPGDVVLTGMGDDQHPDGSVTIELRDFGAANHTAASDRGWVYLERFITMVRVAMIGLDRFDQCVHCTTPRVRGIIEAGARTLAAAVEADTLNEALPQFKTVLQTKRFSAASMDKQQMDAAKGPMAKVSADAAVVCSLMDAVIEHLSTSWQTVRASVVDDAIFEIVSRLYEKVHADPLLSPFFKGTKSSVLKRHQALFFRELWLGRRPPLSDSLHRVWNIHEQHFEVFCNHFDTALHEHFGSECGSRVVAFRDSLRHYKSSIVQRSERLPAPDLSDTAQLAHWLSEASAKARLGPLPEQCAQHAAERLRRASQGADLGGLECPVMSAQAGMALVSVLPPELQAAGQAAFPGVEPPSPTSHYEPLQEEFNDFITRLYERLTADEVTAAFFARETGSAAHILPAQKRIIADLVKKGVTGRLHESMVQVHKPLVISDYQFDRFCVLACDVATDLAPAFGRSLRFTLEGLRTAIVSGNAGVEPQARLVRQGSDHSVVSQDEGESPLLVGTTSL